MKETEDIRNRTESVLRFIGSKLAAAGTLFAGFIMITLGDDAGLYQISEAAGFPYLWWLIYGYGVVFSVLVDLILSKFFPTARVGARIVIYGTGGFAPFVVLFFNTPYIAISGAIGSLCALFSMRRIRCSEEPKECRPLRAWVYPLFCSHLPGVILRKRDNGRRFARLRPMRQASLISTGKKRSRFRSQREKPLC